MPLKSFSVLSLSRTLYKCAFVCFIFLQILSFTCAYWCRHVVLRLLVVLGFFVKSGLGSITFTQNMEGEVCVLEDKEQKGQGSAGMKKMAWECQDRDMSVLYIFSTELGIPDPPTFPSRPRHHTCREERLPPTYSLYLQHTYYVLFQTSVQFDCSAH